MGLVRVLCLTLAAVVTAGLASSEEDTRSLAERAEAARTRRKPASPSSSREKVLTNEDLKRAKGNVIFLTATPAPPAEAAPAAIASSSPMPSAPISSGSISTVAIVDQRQRAARLRGSIEEAQRQLAVATPEQRTALEQRLDSALDELLRAHEEIGALTERVRQGGNAVPPSH